MSGGWGGGGGGGGGVLAAISYSSGVNGVWHSTTSSTLSDIDATNASISPVVPSSGKLVVMIQAEIWETVVAGQMLIGLRIGSVGVASTLTYASQVKVSLPSAGLSNFVNLNGPWVFYLTGLTAGSTTIKAAWAASGSGGATLNVAANDGASGNDPPFVMIAWGA